MTLPCMESCTQQLSVCSLINRKEGSVSRDKRKQYPAFFFYSCRVQAVQQHMIQVILFGQDQCALFDYIELTIVSNTGTA